MYSNQLQHNNISIRMQLALDINIIGCCFDLVADAAQQDECVDLLRVILFHLWKLHLMINTNLFSFVLFGALPHTTITS